MANDVQPAMYSAMLAGNGEADESERLFELSIVRREETVRVVLLFVVLFVALTAPQCVSDRIWLRTALITAVLLTFWTHFAADWLGLRRVGQFDAGATVVVIGDLAWIGLLVHSTGGLDSPFGALLLIPILFAAGLFSQLRLALALVTGSVVGAFVVFAIRASGTVEEPWQLTGMLMAIIAIAWVAYGICLVLERERRTNEIVLRHLSDAVLLLDSSRRVILANPPLERITGLRAKRILGAYVDDLRRKPDYEGLFAITADVTSADPALTPRARDITLERPDRVELHVSTIPCVGRSGGPVGWVVVCQDVTEVTSRVRMKEEGLSMLSHEIRSPLTTLKVVASMLSALAEGVSDDNSAHLMQVIETETDRLLKMAAQLLDVASLDHAAFQLDRVETDVRELVAEVTAAAQLRAAQRDIALQVELPESLPCVHADARRVADALHQLCDNATKYTPRGGEIRVSAARDNGYVCISVADSGKGIPAEQLQTVFEKFTRVESDANRDTGDRSFGLGLYMVKRVIELHGGSVEVESDVGRGSVFRVLLPVEPLKQ